MPLRISEVFYEMKDYFGRTFEKSDLEDVEMSQKTNTLKRGYVKELTKISVLAAVAAVLMLIEFPLFFAPEFYKLDLSEVAVLIGGFALGPIPAVIIELIKVLLNLALNGTVTGGVGEAANSLLDVHSYCRLQ